MMKTRLYKIFEWQDVTGMMDIDWPRVQAQLGSQCVTWLNQLEPHHGALVVQQQGLTLTLTAEFYSESAWQRFVLLKQ